MPKKVEYDKLKNYGKKRSLFKIYADFECFLLSEDNRKQNPKKSYIN